MTVDLWRCTRCDHLWAEEGIPQRCPVCLRAARIPAKIILAGHDVTVRAIREYGLESRLFNAQVRRGLWRVPVGHCAHGYISWHLCPECPPA